MNAAAAFAAVWLIWLLTWIAAAGWSARTASHEDLGAESPARVLNLAGIVMMVAAYSPVQAGVLWLTPELAGWGLLALALAGFAFTWAARLHLGPLWSDTAAPTEDHRIVESGPYGIVRHPVYAGVLLAVWATAFALGRVEGLIGAALATAGLTLRAMLEERALRRDVSDAAYEAYRARVPMLAPLTKFRGG